ncbi:tetratricopeptide repeat protein [Helicobacter monodelphidis]|uniref:tetratricopeptide repeat-containing glycosyltransferase family protein n=1 Tax=Helicobacter sp. 15-1451 TaxID=2004995 RepID=UPI0015EBC81C|nr:tetratricopeptide repeat protein [Helicobacter sp. 15-1451]
MVRRESLQKLYEQALAYHSVGDLNRCVNCCDVILSQDGQDHEVWNLSGLAHYGLGNLQKALTYINQAFLISGFETYLVNIAELLRRSNESQKALEILESIKNPATPNLQFNLARVYRDVGRNADAVVCYEKVLLKTPDDADVLFNLANVLVESDVERAIKLYEQALRLGLNVAGMNLASLYLKRGDIESSLKIYKQLEPVVNKDDHSFFFNYANALSKASIHSSSYFKEAKKYYKKAISFSSNVLYALNYAHLLLRFGEIKEGFKQYEKRLSLNVVPQSLATLEVASRLAKQRIVVYAEQGLGDTIMFARFLMPLREVASEVLVIVQPVLLPLFERYFNQRAPHLCPIAFCSIVPDELKKRTFKRISLLSLPFALKMTSNAEIQSLIPPILEKSCKKVGIFWRSNQENPLSEGKNLTLPELLDGLSPLLSKCDFYSLQVGIDIEERNLLEQYKIPDLGSGFKDFAETKEALEGMDAVIGIDTSILHLAASFGVESFVLLPYYYDWRYGAQGIESPFYAQSLHLYPQECFDNWKSPLQHLQKILLQKIDF